MENQNNHHDGLPNSDEDDDDDEFGDFGGFEAADPVLPNVAQAAGSAPGVQAGPNPWAAMFTPVTTAMNVQPDLLCGQNRFPQHLEGPATADVAGSALASVPQPEGQGSVVNGLDMGLEGELDETGDEDPQQLNLDQIANDILDGSFRSAASNQSGSSYMSHGHEPMPDISGLDLALSVSNESAMNTDNQLADIQLDIDHVTCEQSAAIPRTNQNASADLVTANEGSAGVISNQPEKPQSDVEALLEQSEIEKQIIKKDIERQLLDNNKLQEDLQEAKAAADRAKQKYDDLQIEHAAQLESLRAAGHDALSMIVEEYRELTQTTVVQQQAAWEQKLTDRLTEERERFTELHHQQGEEFECQQIVERNKTGDRIQEAIVEMRQKQEEQFEEQLKQERRKGEEILSKAVQEERVVSTREIERVIGEENRKAKDMLESEQESFKRQLATEVLKYKDEMSSAVAEQQQANEVQLQLLLTEERGRARQMMHEAVAATRGETHTYLQQQQQRDAAVHRRQLASLDLFLESARHQLSLMMTPDPMNSDPVNPEAMNSDLVNADLVNADLVNADLVNSNNNNNTSTSSEMNTTSKNNTSDKS